VKFDREIREIRERRPPHLKPDSVRSLDRNLAIALKAALRKTKTGSGEQSSSEFHKILERVANEDLRRTLQRPFSKVAGETNEMPQPEVGEALRLLRILHERGLQSLQVSGWQQGLPLLRWTRFLRMRFIEQNVLCSETSSAVDSPL
jgi:hypothetical protein